MRVPARSLKDGQEFVTCLTRRAGMALEVKPSRGVEVVLEASPLGKVVWLHPDVLVEVS